MNASQAVNELSSLPAVAVEIASGSGAPVLRIFP
jgi:hypothetical protein